MSANIMVLEAVLAILWLYALYAVVNPGRVVDFTLERSKKTMKFYCFRCTIKKTKKSASVIRNGHAAVLMLLTLYILLLFFLKI